MCLKTYHLFILVFGLCIRREDKVKLVSAKKKTCKYSHANHTQINNFDKVINKYYVRIFSKIRLILYFGRNLLTVKFLELAR